MELKMHVMNGFKDSGKIYVPTYVQIFKHWQLTQINSSNTTLGKNILT